MAVFTSFSDESAGKTKSDKFLFAGWIGPLADWQDFFAPAWDERVLAGPPRIEYLHMTDIRSPLWRESNGITEQDANNRINGACTILDQFINLHPLRVVIRGDFFHNEFSDIRVTNPKRKQFNSSKYEPDYLAFFAYAWAALKYLSIEYPEVEKLDFVVEQKTTVSEHIKNFHAELPIALEALGSPELARLVGSITFGDKFRSPLQAADVLAWHCARREKPKTMSRDDIKRYICMTNHRGRRIVLSKAILHKLRNAFNPISPVTAPQL